MTRGSGNHLWRATVRCSRWAAALAVVRSNLAGRPLRLRAAQVPAPGTRAEVRVELPDRRALSLLGIVADAEPGDADEFDSRGFVSVTLDEPLFRDFGEIEALAELERRAEGEAPPPGGETVVGALGGVVADSPSDEAPSVSAAAEFDAPSPTAYSVIVRRKR